MGKESALWLNVCFHRKCQITVLLTISRINTFPCYVQWPYLSTLICPTQAYNIILYLISLQKVSHAIASLGVRRPREGTSLHTSQPGGLSVVLSNPPLCHRPHIFQPDPQVGRAFSSRFGCGGHWLSQNSTIVMVLDGNEITRLWLIVMPQVTEC